MWTDVGLPLLWHFWARKSHFNKSSLRNRRRQPVFGGIRKNKGTKVFWSVPAWKLPPPLGLMKYFRGVTLPQITDNYKPNCKTYTIGKLQLYAHTMRVTAHDPRLYAMQTETGLHGFKGIVVITSQLKVSGNTSQRHNQTNGYVTVRESIPLQSAWFDTRSHSLIGVRQRGPFNIYKLCLKL
jgi:hypothetical protein